MNRNKLCACDSFLNNGSFLDCGNVKHAFNF